VDLTGTSGSAIPAQGGDSVGGGEAFLRGFLSGFYRKVSY
jgi:hypothetical protein